MVRRFGHRSGLASPVAERGFRHAFGHLFFERADGRDKFIRLMRADKAKYIKSYESYGAGAPPIYDPTITELTKLLNANNYQKGGWTLHISPRDGR